MKNGRRILLVVTFVSMSGALLQGERMLSKQRVERSSLQRESERLKARLADQIREQDATARELVLAEAQLAELAGPPHSHLTELERAHETAVGDWIARVKRLKSRFAQNPDQRIQEMRLLTDDDWLRVSKQVDMDSEDGIRKACAAARSAAKRRFVASLAKAVQRFYELSKGQPPATGLALAPYLENATDAEFLANIEIATNVWSPQEANAGIASWEAREKAPIDTAYDSRYTINGNGGRGIAPAPQAWIPDFQPRYMRAHRDFSEANHGAVAAGLRELLPYFSPPLDSATVDKLLKAEREWQ